MVKRLSCIPNRFIPNDAIEIFDYEINKDYDDVEIVDTSGYVPNKQAVQVLNRQFAMEMLNSLAFDLPKDIASGAVNLFARRRNIDIAELSQHQAKLKSLIEKNISDARRSFERKRSQPSKTPPVAPSGSGESDKKD